MTSLETRWAYSLGGRIQRSRPVLGEAHVFVDSLDSDLYALSRADGTVAWTHERDGALSDSAPAYRDGVVYVGSGGGSVHALDATSGSELWADRDDSAIVAAPAVQDGVVYAGRTNGTVSAVSTDDTARLWNRRLDSPIHADLAVSPAAELVYATTSTGGVYALDATSGDVVWSHQFSAAVTTSAPVVDDETGRVFIAASEVLALTADTGTPVWTTDFYGTSAGAAPVVDDGSIYAGSGDGTVYALSDAVDGGMIRTAPTWSVKQWSTVVATPLLLEEFLVVGSTDGTLSLFDCETGNRVATHTLSEEIRGLAGTTADEIYVSRWDGTVVSLSFHE